MLDVLVEDLDERPIVAEIPQTELSERSLEVLLGGVDPLLGFFARTDEAGRDIAHGLGL